MPVEKKSRTTINIVRPDQPSAETLQTSGSQRMTAISAEQGITSALWAGTFLVEPGAKTGISPSWRTGNGSLRTPGEAVVRWGDLGEHRATVRAGDFLHVPSWPHQEINLSTTNPFRWVVVRSAPEPIVVNLPDEFWGPVRAGS